MTRLFTLDASVFVAACQPQEAGYEASQALLNAMLAARGSLVEPAILPVEVGAALRRVEGQAAMAMEYAESIYALPRLILTEMDEQVSRRALALAIECRLRGADALYVLTAVQFGARLVTLDAEQLKRAPASVAACKPDAAVALLWE
jgi:predicted nucleic acid-binding protein